MWFRNRLIGFIFGLVLFLMMAPAVCGQERVNGNRPGSSRIIIALEGTVRVSGAWALYPMMVKWADEFRNVYPKVRVDISAGGAGKGVTDALVGLVNVGMVSREITQEEVRQGAFYVPVVKDAVFPMMSDQNRFSITVCLKRGSKKRPLLTFG